MVLQHIKSSKLAAHDDCEFREMLDRVGDKWTLFVLVVLEQRPTQRPDSQS